jgi:putative hydrolase of the HAD superfamily
VSSASRKVKDQQGGSQDIKAVILDYGQVLVRCPTVPEFGRMAQMFNVSFESFSKLWEDSRNVYDRGDVTAEEYWLQLAAQTNTTLTTRQIETLREVEVEIWAHADQDMIDWLSRLREAGIKTGLLSNMPLDLRKYVLANLRWMDNFDFKTFSAEVRLIKPDPAIFEHTLHGLGVVATEAVFVDDRAANIDAALGLGIHGIQFHSVAQLGNELKELGLPVRPTVAPSSAASGAASPTERSGQGIKFQL